MQTTESNSKSIAELSDCRTQVLLVEDTKTDACYVQEILSPSMYSLHHVESLAAALEYVSQSAVHVILLDLGLPDGVGIKTFVSMKDAAPEIPILVLTGFDDDDMALLAVTLGAQDYIPKQHLTEHNLSRSIRHAIERKRFEESIRKRALEATESESALKLALEASQTGTWTFDLATHKITSDEQLEAIFGVVGNRVGDHLEDFLNRIVGEDRDRVEQTIAAAIKDKSVYEVEYRIIWMDGSLHHILAKGNLLNDKDGNPVKMAGVCVDISKRKEAEQRLRLALKASRTGTWMCEIENGNLVWDDEMHALFGVKPGESNLKFEDYVNLLVPADIDSVMQSADLAVEQGREFHAECGVVWPDGSIHYIESRGQVYYDYPLRTAGVCVDITERKIAEQERSQLAAIVESSEDAIISKNLDGTILSWNHAAEKIYGFSAAEMIGKNVSLLLADDSNDELLSSRAKSGNGASGEHREGTRVRKDGVRIDVSVTLSLIKDSSGNVSGASTIVRDITNQKRSDRLNFAQNDVTRILSESDSLAIAAPGILQLIARATGSQVGALWCIDRDQHILRCVDVWYDPDPALTEFAALSRHITFSTGGTPLGRVLSTGRQTVIADLALDGSDPRAHAAAKGGLHGARGFPILLGTKVLGVLEFFSKQNQEANEELTKVMAIIGSQIGQFIDRKYAEHSVQKAVQAQLKIGQAIMHNAPIGIAWLDKNLVISEANAAFSKQFGPVGESLAGKFIFQYSTGIPVERLLEVISKGVPFSATNFRIAMAGVQGPRDAFCDMTVWPVKEDDNQIVGLVILTVEVTERVKLAKQREDFVATLTHDLKNPLIGQDRMLGLMLDERLGPILGEQANVLSLLKEGTQQLLKLIGTLLEVYRYEEGAPQLRITKFDPADLITACIGQMTPISEAKSITLTHSYPETSLSFSGDEMALRRVVMNLLDNAIKFTANAGAINVSCRGTASSLIINFEDNGSGVSEEEQQTLFQRFAQAGSGKKYRAGTGLGLYLCRQIVEAHSGTITCVSREGMGSIFSVTLPIRGRSG